ncbi:MAG: diguanylate cyclase [Lachnospiraceae bacterium]|nr:diguanylate cyclase [Lachnospiraceae bacterium]
MLYSVLPALALILNLILNIDTIKNVRHGNSKENKRQSLDFHYGHFLMSANLYFLVDTAWGIMYERKDVQALFRYIYTCTVFYFLLMLLTMLMWTRFVVVYIDKTGPRSFILQLAVWIMFVLGVISLMINRFKPFIFIYNEAHEYIELPGRYILVALQIVFYTIISIYMLYVAHRTTGQQRVRYSAVAWTSVVMEFALIGQIFHAYLPICAAGLIISISLVHCFVEVGEKKEKEIHDHIASVMAEDYEAIFYIDIGTGAFLEFSKSRQYSDMNVPVKGTDFFAETIETIETYVYPEDREYARGFYSKEIMLKNLEGRRSFSFKYRVLVKNVPRYFLFTVMPDNNGQYLIFYEKDIEDELKAEKKQKENQKKTVTFGQIAESLASNYDEIYYVNIEDESFVRYEVNNIFGQLETSKSGDDFFGESVETMPQIVHKQDCDKVEAFLNKDYLISALEQHKNICLDYRIVVSGKTRYVRMTAHKTSDGTHFIIGVENVDAEIKKEKQHIRELNTQKELARRDELTGVKNKTAYKELMESVQGNIDNGMDYLPFAIIVCDANNLKQINDTQGHAAGDRYLKEAAQFLCDIFVHSPVFRVGGDEFVVFLRGNDYSSRHELMGKLRSRSLKNQRDGTGVILASGMSDFIPDKDNLANDVFDRADKEMYVNKRMLKAE